MASIFYLISGSSALTSSTVVPANMLAIGLNSFPGTSSTTQPGTNTITQCTNTAGGTLLTWMTHQASAFTLSGSVTCSLWGYEANPNNNSGLGFRLWHKSGSASLNGNGAETAIMAAVISSSTELGSGIANLAAYTMSASLTTTVFQRDDRLLLRIYTVPIGNMGTGTTTVFYGSTTLGTNGVSYLQFSQNVPLRERYFVDIG